jgi:uncharacterized membrane protein YoaK (UPF0700 family)
MKLTLPMVLSLNAGYVDTAGYVALHGLFTAHVTGNFVTLGAAAVFGLNGALAKILALPVFCIVVVLTRLLDHTLPRLGLRVLRTKLVAQMALLVIAAILAIAYSPLKNADGWSAVLTGMTLISAMAIQNTAHRVHLGSSPPSTLMTGTTTQVMMDLADLLHGSSGSTKTAGRSRLARMSLSIILFACGCGLAAFAYTQIALRCFIPPPFFVLIALAVSGGADEVIH